MKIELEVPLPVVGQHVELRRDVDRFPQGSVPVGSKGVVAHVEDGIISVKMNNHFDFLAEWDNCLAWCDGNCVLMPMIFLGRFCWNFMMIAFWT